MAKEVEFLRLTQSNSTGWSMYGAGDRAHFDEPRAQALVDIGDARYIDAATVVKQSISDLINYPKIKLSQLRVMASERGLSVAANARKSVVIAALKKDDRTG